MEKVILIAINEYFGVKFQKLEDALKRYSKEEILDGFLRYEGIIGYTNRITEAMKLIGFIQGEDEGRAETSLKEAQSFRHLPEGQRGSYALKVYDLGMQLKKNCPNDDCRIYRNTFGMCCELDEQIILLSGWPRKVMESELRKSYLELEGMYMMNYAVKQYRRAHEVHPGRESAS